MPISVCLLNYNSYSDTIECIDSMLCQTTNDFAIIIVDNCSTNDSLIQISSYLSVNEVDFSYHTLENSSITNIESINRASTVFILANSHNSGFSAGNNIAIRFSKTFFKNNHLLLLNNDTLLVPNFLEIMLNEYNRFKIKYKKPIALGAVEYNYYSKHKSHSGFHYLNLLSALVFSKPVFPYYKYLCGACIMIDQKAPLMDENYFLYFDDIEYSKTLSLMGYKLLSTNKVFYYHKISASMKNAALKVEYQFRSTWMFYKKHYSKYLLIVFLIRNLQYKISRKKNIVEIISRTFINR